MTIFYKYLSYIAHQEYLLTSPTFSLHDKPILLIDANSTSLQLLKRSMETLGGSNIAIAKDAAQAAKLCQASAFDIIISDLKLGNGPTGLQLLELLRVNNLIDVSTLFLLVSEELQRPPLMGKAEIQPDDYILKPFSPPTLSIRMAKAMGRRRQLKPIYAALADNDIKQAIISCKKEMDKTSRYRQFCSIILIELLWRLGDYKKALQFLTPLLNDQQLPWAVIAMARTQLYLQQFTDATETARSILDNRMVAPDAHEVLAQCLLRADQLSQACIEVKQAIDLAPHSIDRQYLGCEISQAAGDFEFAKQCCLQMLEQTRHSIHRSVGHLCNYIRAIVDQAEHCEDKSQADQLHQQALGQLQKEKQSDLVKSDSSFNYDTFTLLIKGRIEALQGQLNAAREALSAASPSDTASLSPHLIADSAILMDQLGAYDQLASLMNNVEMSQLEPLAKQRIEQIQEASAEVLSELEALLHDAKSAQQQGQYRSAYQHFKQALTLSPSSVNIQLAMVTLAIKMQSHLRQPDPDLNKDCYELNRQLQRLPKTEQQNKQWRQLYPQLKPYLP